MIGIDSATGRYLHGNEHLRQSVTDILSTLVGSRVLLREYGSRLFSLLDNPQDDFTRVRIV
ncbi:GPW/gp25 family protein, partial [Escherichia coli]